MYSRKLSPFAETIATEVLTVDNYKTMYTSKNVTRVPTKEMWLDMAGHAMQKIEQTLPIGKVHDVLKDTFGSPSIDAGHGANLLCSVVARVGYHLGYGNLKRDSAKLFLHCESVFVQRGTGSKKVILLDMEQLRKPKGLHLNHRGDFGIQAALFGEEAQAVSLSKRLWGAVQPRVESHSCRKGGCSNKEKISECTGKDEESNRQVPGDAAKDGKGSKKRKSAASRKESTEEDDIPKENNKNKKQAKAVVSTSGSSSSGEDEHGESGATVETRSPRNVLRKRKSLSVRLSGSIDITIE
jgi:hypothetical protein